MNQSTNQASGARRKQLDVSSKWVNSPRTDAWNELWRTIFSDILQSSNPPLPQDSEKEVNNG